MRRKLGLWGVVLVLVAVICGVTAIGLLLVMGREAGEEFAGVAGPLGGEEIEVTRIVRETVVETVVERAATDVSLASYDVPGSSLTERLIIRSAHLSLVVRDTETTLDQVNALVDELGGYVVSSQLSKYDQGVRANLTARVPADSLETALARLRDLALEVRHQSISGQDVTDVHRSGRAVTPPGGDGGAVAGLSGGGRGHRGDAGRLRRTAGGAGRD